MKNNHIIKSYVDVCNKALRLNKDRFPFKQIFSAAKKAENNKNIEVILKDFKLSESYVFTVKSEQIIARPHGECHNCQCDRKWNVEKSYLVNVVQSPEEYIQNPAKINWDWMYDIKQ